ncbi:hypothetical protein N9K16_06595 [Alphaproteobacteria bacterium]|nr:hypothetical protein [Alphaproteobacteria bacterium]
MKNRIRLKNAISYNFVILLLASLIFFEIVVQFSLSNNKYFFSHDTLLAFQVFDFSHSHILQYGEYPHWYPDIGYGMSAMLLNNNIISPIRRLVSFLGYLLEIDASLLLFKTSLAIEKLIFILGVFCVGLRLNFNRSAMVFATVTASLSLVIHHQIFFALQIFYLFPTYIYIILSFFSSRNWNWLLIGIIIGSASFIGQITYFIPLQFWFLAIYATLLALHIKPDSHKFTLPKPYIVVFTIISVIIFVTSLFSFNEFVESVADGRDENYSVSLHTFLTYALGSPLTALSGYLTGSLYNSDNSYYIGMLPLCLIVSSFFRRLAAPYYIIMFVCLLLIGLVISPFLTGFFGRIMRRVSLQV